MSVEERPKKARAKRVPGRSRAGDHRRNAEAQIQHDGTLYSPWEKFASNGHIQTYVILQALLAIEARLEQIAHHLGERAE